jgi:diaminohydroxyphosphoribosylaminopyrimidine deaminase/5-amino-6-(5-phosphoribosylamino)uracil reductase
MVDPDPLVNGKGISRLKQLKIDFEIDIQKKKCQRLLEGYAMHRIKGRPLFTLKAAVTLDGALATTTGDSKWISSKASRALAHRMRAEADAVLIGVETAIVDDPELTVRLYSGQNPLRIVMDSELKTPPGSKLIMSAGQAPVILAHTNTASLETVAQRREIEGVETLECDAGDDGMVNPVDLAHKLGLRGILSVLVEGGSHVHGALAHSGIADRVALFIAPKVIGSGLQWISFPGITSIKDALTIDNLEITQVEDDLLLEGRFARTNL